MKNNKTNNKYLNGTFEAQLTDKINNKSFSKMIISIEIMIKLIINENILCLLLISVSLTLIAL